MRLGTRGSALALAQAGLVARAIGTQTGEPVDLVRIATSGDCLSVPRIRAITAVPATRRTSETPSERSAWTAAAVSFESGAPPGHQDQPPERPWRRSR